jgi:hypothetical protein
VTYLSHHQLNHPPPSTLSKAFNQSLLNHPPPSILCKAFHHSHPNPPLPSTLSKALSQNHLNNPLLIPFKIPPSTTLSIHPYTILMIYNSLNQNSTTTNPLKPLSTRFLNHYFGHLLYILLKPLRHRKPALLLGIRRLKTQSSTDTRTITM